MRADKRDVFLCHASDDKDVFVRPLRDALEQAGIFCWFDEDDIGWGDLIPKKINEGISMSRYLMVVLSPAFIRTFYAQGELSSALHTQLSTGKVKVLPLLVGSKEQMVQFLEKEFPLLVPVHYVVWDNAKAVVDMLLPLVRPDSKTVGRVCFISSEYPPHVEGGLGVHVWQLTTALAAHLNVDVVLPTPSGDDYQFSSAQVHLRALDKAEASYDKPVSWLRFANVAAETMIDSIYRDTRPDVIHCHDWVTVLAGIRCSRALKIPLVLHLHLPNRTPLCASVENLGLVCADLITVNSRAMHRELMGRQLKLRPDVRVEIVKNGVDLNVFRPCTDWPADDGYILFVGRLVEQKGVEYLLRAFAYVKEASRFSEVRLKIVGEGPWRPLLEGLCTNLMLSDRVEFLGWKTGQDLVSLYQKARVVAIPSIYEPFGMTALESLACQRPVVASKEGGLSEIITHDTGYLAGPKDHLDLAQWLMTLLSNSDLRNRMGEAGRAHVCSEGYTWPQIAQRFIELYKGLLRKSPDINIPARAEEFKDQIANVATEMEPVLGDQSNDELKRLFDWRVRS